MDGCAITRRAVERPQRGLDLTVEVMTGLEDATAGSTVQPRR